MRRGPTLVLVSLTALALSLLLFFGSMARAQTAVDPYSTQNVMRQCGVAARFAAAEFTLNRDHVADIHTCLSFVRGVRDATRSNVLLPPICDAGATDGQRAMVFHQWAQEHPQHWHQPASNSVVSALREAFPCT